MLYRFRTTLNKRWFDWQARAIYDTAPVRCAPDSPLVILTQLHHPDVTMYMVAAKSFARWVKPGLFVIVDDGLTDADRGTLQRHFERISFIRSTDASSPNCPRGSCWERLLSIADLNTDHYVVQLDADTITLNRPDLVIDCLERGVSFTLGTEGGDRVVSTQETSRIAAPWEGDHVQVVAEQRMAQLPPGIGTQYVHGCAGFAGFQPGAIERTRVEQVSRAFESLVGPAKWAEWGSEQVTSNFLVANTPEAVILPPTTYPFWQPGIDIRRAGLVHFFGTHRFEGGAYVDSARATCRAQMAS